MNSSKMRLFWFPLSIMKCNGVSFTHICEWKRCFPSPGFCGSYSWILMVVMVVVGSGSMICLLLLFFELGSESRINSIYLSSTTNDSFERHSSMLCKGMLWKSHHFAVSFIIFSLPFFSCGLDWLSWGWMFCELGIHLPYFGYCTFANPNSHFLCCLNFFSIMIAYR
jgi:hypothetical protein